MKQKTKTIIIGMIMLIVISLTNIVSATPFNKEPVCKPQWYCTTYSQTSCGNRTCMDVNACSSNFNTPPEFLSCDNSLGKDTNKDGEDLTNLLPQGYFTLDTEIIKLSLEQEKVVQQIIRLNSSSPETYSLEINYPSSYTKGTDFFTTSNNNKYIDNYGDFNIIIDTRSIMIGTYVIPIKIYNDKYSRIILAIVDVVPKGNPKIELKIDSPIKTVGADKEIIVELSTKDIDLVPGNSITYTIIDPKGNIITQQDSIIEDKSKNVESISLSKDLEEGYYTLAVKMEDATRTYTKSSTFTILQPNKYIPIIEKIPKTHYVTIIIIVILIIIGLIIAWFNTNLFYRSHKSGKKYKYSKGITMLKLSFGKPNIKITLGTGELFKKISTKFHKNSPITDPDKRLELIKKSYERGFLSLKEYRDALKNQGFSVESNKVSDYYEEIKNKERVEGTSKHNSENKTEHSEILKIKEEQRKEIEKIESAVIKQEEELRKEAEHERKLKEKEEKIELREEKKEKELEEEIKEENKKQEEKEKNILAEIKIAEKIESIEKEKNEEKIFLNPISHIISKENVLDKRIGENQTFVLNSGEKLYCIRDILNLLPLMSEPVFNHHTKHGRNDFANWIGDVFQYYDIAEEVRNTESKEEMMKILRQYN